MDQTQKEKGFPKGTRLSAMCPASLELPDPKARGLRIQLTSSPAHLSQPQREPVRLASRKAVSGAPSTARSLQGGGEMLTALGSQQDGGAEAVGSRPPRPAPGQLSSACVGEAL